jgi:hypothetical protein
MVTLPEVETCLMILDSIPRPKVLPAPQPGLLCLAMIAMSPLHHQKQFRFQPAWGRMLVDEVDLASAVLEVGYESASQFNRE